MPPAFALGAHLAPLDIVEYRGAGYPGDMQGDLFVTSHGSWNREIAQVGRCIIRLKMGANGPTESQNFLGKKVAARRARAGRHGRSAGVDPHRQGGPATFSDDTSGTVNKIGYKP